MRMMIKISGKMRVELFLGLQGVREDGFAKFSGKMDFGIAVGQI